MKPLPDIHNAEAMRLRGIQASINGARNDAAGALRDAVTVVQGCSMAELRGALVAVDAAAERLRTVAALWDESQ